MNKTQIINLIEKRFLFNHNMRDKRLDQGNNKEAQIYAILACECCDLLAEINNSSEDHEFERLYKKFNLFKGE